MDDEKQVLLEKLRRAENAYYDVSNEVEQVLGKVLGYPKFADDPKNFPPPHKDPDLVCVGEHVPQSIAEEAAARIRSLEKQLSGEDDEKDCGS